MFTSNVNILLKPEKEQAYIASRSSNSKTLDELANSDSVLVRLTVLANPAVDTSTLLRKVDDEDSVVWKKANEILNQRKGQ